MRIEVLYFDGCPNHEALLPRLRELGLHSGGFIERWSAQPTPARS